MRKILLFLTIISVFTVSSYAQVLTPSRGPVVSAIEAFNDKTLADDAFYELATNSKIDWTAKDSNKRNVLFYAKNKAEFEKIASTLIVDSIYETFVYESLIMNAHRSDSYERVFIEKTKENFSKLDTLLSEKDKFGHTIITYKLADNDFETASFLHSFTNTYRPEMAEYVLKAFNNKQDISSQDINKILSLYVLDRAKGYDWAKMPYGNKGATMTSLLTSEVPRDIFAGIVSNMNGKNNYYSTLLTSVKEAIEENKKATEASTKENAAIMQKNGQEAIYAFFNVKTDEEKREFVVRYFIWQLKHNDFDEARKINPDLTTDDFWLGTYEPLLEKHGIPITAYPLSIEEQKKYLAPEMGEKLEAFHKNAAANAESFREIEPLKPIKFDLAQGMIPLNLSKKLPSLYGKIELPGSENAQKGESHAVAAGRYYASLSKNSQDSNRNTEEQKNTEISKQEVRKTSEKITASFSAANPMFENYIKQRAKGTISLNSPAPRRSFSSAAASTLAFNAQPATLYSNNSAFSAVTLPYSSKAGAPSSAPERAGQNTSVSQNSAADTNTSAQNGIAPFSIILPKEGLTRKQERASAKFHRQQAKEERKVKRDAKKLAKAEKKEEERKFNLWLADTKIKQAELLKQRAATKEAAQRADLLLADAKREEQRLLTSAEKEQRKMIAESQKAAAEAKLLAQKQEEEKAALLAKAKAEEEKAAAAVLLAQAKAEEEKLAAEKRLADAKAEEEKAAQLLANAQTSVQNNANDSNKPAYTPVIREYYRPPSSTTVAQNIDKANELIQNKSVDISTVETINAAASKTETVVAQAERKEAENKTFKGGFYSTSKNDKGKEAYKYYYY
ncbi:hypothetical protein Dip518_000924 [Parelusimicrobium proximum]|uniref:hypothetical protein n=1 Tax=Parelusimicrobium proximum TaxID=3228953 RepID=UPI003D17703F